MKIQKFATRAREAGYVPYSTSISVDRDLVRACRAKLLLETGSDSLSRFVTTKMLEFVEQPAKKK